MLTPHFSALDAAYQLHFYLCFKTHWLRPLFVKDDHHQLVTNVLNSVCSKEQYQLLESSIRSDYVRLLLSLKPRQDIARAAKLLKGNVAREFAAAFNPPTKSIWARGYFARSSGKVSLEKAQSYVALQTQHHGYRGEWTKPMSYRNRSFQSPAFTLAHSMCMLDYHIVLTTTQRKALFDEAIAPGLFAYIGKVGLRHGFAVERMGLLPDHLHLIIEAIPSLSVERCVFALLNNTHQWMNKRFYGVLKATAAWDVWQPSFYAATVGTYSTAQVKLFLGGS